MAIYMPRYLETRRQFLANRATFPAEELAEYSGQWVAWSPYGLRVVASAGDPALLGGILQAASEDPLLRVIEGIPDDEAPAIDADGSVA